MMTAVSTNSRLALSVAWSTAWLLLGCDRQSAPLDASVGVDTIHGAVHVMNHGSGQWTEDSRWRVREIFRIGARAEPVEQLFTSQLLGADIGPHGNVYVLDHLAGTLSVFTQDGRFVRRIGQRGRGPSDLASPTGYTWTDDGHLWVSDPGNMKYAIFDTTGAFVNTYRRLVPAYPRRQSPLVYADELGVIDEGSAGENLFLLRTTLDGATRDTLMVVARDGGPSKAVMDAFLRRPGDEFTRVGRYYISRMKWALDPSGGIWTGSPEELRFVKRDWNGDTLLVVTADHRKSQLTSADERLITTAMHQSGLPRSAFNPVRPLFQALHVLRGGYLLVQLVDIPGVASRLFDVYDPRGYYLGELDFGFAPESLGGLGSRGDLVVAPMLGESDVPYVVGVELIR